MRGFHSEEETSKVVTQKTIEEYSKIILFCVKDIWM